MNFLTLLPLLIQGATALAPLIGAVSPTLAAKLPAAAATAKATTATDLVTFIQQMLVASGDPVTVDGELGPETIAAVDAWIRQELAPIISTASREALSTLQPSPAASAAGQKP